MNSLPCHLHDMIGHGLAVVTDAAERDELRIVVNVVALAVFDQWLSRRTPDDNRVEHEFVVFGAAMRIAEAEHLPLSGKLVVACVTFLHDTHPIPRITERQIRDAMETDARLAAELQQRKSTQRKLHMQGGARNAAQLLSALRHPERPGEAIVSAEVRERCETIIGGHDLWKLGIPHPPSGDREALVCFESDALWPLHPLGTLADLERPDESGAVKDVNDPGEWRKQARHNLETLREYRANWQDSDEVFQDRDTIFRTAEGYRLYREWAGVWGL